MSGHGHVTPNANGTKARCGGPALCKACALELSSATHRYYSPITQSSAKSAQRNARHILRFARLAFPAIRVGRTALAMSQSDSYVIIPRQSLIPDCRYQFSARHIDSPHLPRIELRLRDWFYYGKRWRMRLTLAYDATEDVCVVQNNCVWLERWR